MTLALIFPGQGSQSIGMSRSLAREEPLAMETLRRADEVLDFPISQLMWDGPEEELTATVNAQPAILAHSVAVLRVIQDRIGPVAYTAGHSLGEFTAHVAAGTLGFEDALLAVRLRGTLMYEAGTRRPGTMAAVLGLDDEVVDEVCSRAGRGVCVPANYNARGQVVVSGDVAAVDEVMELAREAGAKKVMGLNVSGAFHSPLMEPAADGLREHLAGLQFHEPTLPVVSNVTGSDVRDGDRARDLLVEQLTAPVRWSASIEGMLRAGVDRFLEVGPGRVLAGLNRRNAKGVATLSLGEPDDLASLDGAWTT